MAKLNVKNGTPAGNEHLCKRCTWGQYMTGYRESDMLVICTNTNPNIRVPFTVFDCSEFNDKHRPDYKQMKKLAIEFHPRGFQPVPLDSARSPRCSPSAVMMTTRTRMRTKSPASADINTATNTICRWRRVRILRVERRISGGRRFESCLRIAWRSSEHTSAPDFSPAGVFLAVTQKGGALCA